MAHDFNNALAAINGYATLIDDGLADASPIKGEISQIIKAVKRAAELTSKFQDFARNPKLDRQGGGDV
jgi:signal transduction histidine kinase